MAKKETAEQKLLKMIEASGSPSGGAQPKQKFAKKRNVLAWMETFNVILFLLVILTGVLLAHEIQSSMVRMNQEVHFPAARSARSSSEEENLIPTIQRLSFYLAGIKQRNIFQPFEYKDVSGQENTAAVGRFLAQKVKSLKLVGVSWLDTVSTASVMIEDLEERATHFKKQGEKLGDVIIKTIYADSVKLGYENEEIILYYDKSQM